MAEEVKQFMKRISLSGSVVFIAVLVIVMGTAVSAGISLGLIKDSLKPAQQVKAATVAQSADRLVLHLLDQGVPLGRFGRMDQVLASRLKGHADLEYLAIYQPDQNRILYQAQADTTALLPPVTSLMMAEKQFALYRYPLMQNGQQIAEIWVGFDPGFMAQVFEEIGYDIATILVVTLLLAMELLMFITTYHIKTPMLGIHTMLDKVAEKDLREVVYFPGKDELSHLGNRVAAAMGSMTTRLRNVALGNGYQLPEGEPRRVGLTRLSFVRPPLFLVIFSESMSLSFFPAYVNALYEPIAGLSPTMVVGLPISVFMLVWALSLPVAGQWSDSVGRKKAFMVGAGLTAVGLLLTAWCDNLWQLLIVRSITAVGYGVVFITAQGYVTDNTTVENRTRGMAMFLSGFFSGSLCGAAIGGILSDRIGFEATFMLSATLSLVSAVFVMQFFEAKEKDPDAPPPAVLSFSDFTTLLTDKYFLLITFLSAIPAKLLLTGFLYYAGPVYLNELGANQSSVGRILMAYGLAIVLISPLSAWLGDRLKNKSAFIMFGGGLSALALFAVYLIPGVYGMFTGVLLLGVAHGVGVSPQLSLLTEKVKLKNGLTLGKTIGIFRLTERIGNIAGPLVAATLISFMGFQNSFLWLSSGVAASLILLVVLYSMFRSMDQRQLQEV
ncbi:Predicted arabinose efflux permease, MFS family [Oceanospirillum linum]|nr:Predicted arabinose efflux permease, MFS family [Oleiphilus messinensis]SMP10223.1 Predicted arabinose efflux permease, MFS family [Oceanospirillum linum]